jgi:hypothetical protein
MMRRNMFRSKYESNRNQQPMKTQTTMKTAVLCTTIVGLIAATAGAADVTWQTPLTISGASDVSLDGTLVGTWGPGDDYGSPNRSDDHPVNGVTFAAYGSGFFDTANGFSSGGFADRYNGFGGGFDTGNADYNYLLTVAEYTYGPDWSFTLNGLSVGSTYEIELWADDGRGNDRIQTFTGGANTSATLFVGPSSGGPGQFILGTFVADGTGSETISASSPTGPILNLAQIRDITPVPEPSTLAVLALGTGAMLFGFLRKSRAS